MAENNPEGTLEIFQGLVSTVKLFILNNETISIMGLKIHGSPYSPRWGGFSEDKQEYVFQGPDPILEVLAWQHIPQSLDILITHTPAKGVLDMGQYLDSIGSETLAMKIREMDSLKLHGCGHVHSNDWKDRNGILVVWEIRHKGCEIIFHEIL